MEPIFRMTQTVEAIHVDPFQRLKPSAVLYFAQEAAGQHCVELGLDWETLAARNICWVLAKQRVKITRLPMCGETITIETWPMPTGNTHYPRATVAYDQEGKELFSVHGIWVLMNFKTRGMILPGKSDLSLAGIQRGNEIQAPGNFRVTEFRHQMTRTVRYSELDRNGHMNNTRYIDWVADLLPGEFHKTHPFNTISVWYSSEALEGEELTLQWMLDGSVLHVVAHRSKTDVSDKKERVFAAQVAL